MFFSFKLKLALKRFWEEAESQLEDESVFVRISCFFSLAKRRETTPSGAK